MADTVGVVQVILSGKDQSLASSMKKAGKHVDDLRDQFKRATQVIATLTAGWATFEGVKKFGEMVRAGMDSVMQLRDEAQQLGITTEKMAGLGLAAEKAGVGHEEFARAIAKMQQAISGAEVENAKAIDSFRKIGITLSDLSGKDTQQQLQLVAQHITSMGSASDKTAASMDIFGKGGYKMLELLRDSAGGFEESEKSAKALGLAFSDVDTLKVEEAAKQLREAELATKALGQTFAVELSPYIFEASKAFTDAAKETSGFRDSIRDGIKSSMVLVQAFAATVMTIHTAWQFVKLGWMTIVAGITGTIGVIEVGIRKLCDIIRITFNVTKDAALYAWKAIEYGFWSLLESTTPAMKAWVENIGKVLSYVNKDFADAAEIVAAKWEQSWAKNSIAAKKSLDTIGQDLAKSAKDYSKTANTVFTTFDFKGSFFGGISAAFAEEMQLEADEITKSIASKRSFFNTLSNIIENSAKNAQKRAIERQRDEEKKKTDVILKEVSEREKQKLLIENRFKMVEGMSKDPQVIAQQKKFEELEEDATSYYSESVRNWKAFADLQLALALDPKLTNAEEAMQLARHSILNKNEIKHNETMRKIRENVLSWAQESPEVKNQQEKYRRIMALAKESYTAEAALENEEARRKEDQATDTMTDPEVRKQLAVQAAILRVKAETSDALYKQYYIDRQVQLSAAGSFLGDLGTLTEDAAKKNRAFFYINKAFGMAQAEVNAWIAFSNVMASPLIPGIPAETAAGIRTAMAATTLAAGQVAVGRIAAQEMGGRAAGGSVLSGGLYQVNERGPEMLSVGDKSYLMMGNKSGMVTPNAGRSPAPNVTVNIHTQPGTTARTENGGTSDAPTLEVFIEKIDQATAAGIRSGTSATSRALQSTYGVNRSRGGY